MSGKAKEGGVMARYRVVVRHTSTEVVDAENEYMAAVIVADRLGDGAEIADVQRANGRNGSSGNGTANGNGHANANGNGNGTATATKRKRRPLSPEARANLAANLVKARAARAAKARARKRASGATKKTTKRTAKKR